MASTASKRRKNSPRKAKKSNRRVKNQTQLTAENVDEKLLELWNEDAADDVTSAPALDDKDEDNGAHHLRALLKETFENDDDLANTSDRLSEPKTLPRQEQHRGNWRNKVIKSLLGLLLAIVVIWQPAQRVLQVSSVEAVVNARLVTLRAPIKGVVKAVGSKSRIGQTTVRGQALINIFNIRVDRARLDDLQRELAHTIDQRLPIGKQLTLLAALRRDLRAQLKQFKIGRISQLELRQKALDAEISGAIVQSITEDTVLERRTALHKKGYVSNSGLDEVKRNAHIAREHVNNLQTKKESIAIELTAIIQGSFIGDSYNDRPNSSQRLDDLAQKIFQLEADIARLNLRRIRLQEALAKEQQRFEKFVSATLYAPLDGRVWELLVAPGEQVTHGQELLRLLDCSSAVVTATVSEAVYNSLSLGMGATFRFREGGGDLRGHVVQLTGIASAPAKLAILPSALVKESYRVMVEILGVASSKSCHVGRTGRVVFDKKPSPIAAQGN